MRDYHRKPPKKIRSVEDAMQSAERMRAELPQIIQVLPHDWDKVILADEIKRLSKLVNPPMNRRM